MTLTTWRVYLRARRMKCDLYHIHDPEMLFAALLLRLRAAQVMYSAHEDAPRDMLSKHYLPLALRPLLSRAVELIEALICPHMSAIIAATETIAARMRSLNPNVTVVRNFPRLDEFARLPQGWARRPPVIVYAGTVNRVRGIREIIEALDLLPSELEVRLVLAGTFSPASLESEVASLPGWRRVDWMGAIDPSDVPNILSHARAGLAVYHAEANHVAAEPYKLFEYMAAGIPVIASDFSHWRNIIGGAQCGILVDPRKPAEIAGAISRLISDPELAETLGRNGRTVASSRYDGSIEAAKLVKACLGLCIASGGTRPTTRQ